MLDRLHKDIEEKRMVLAKLDMSKCFDRVRYDHTHVWMKRMGLPDKLCGAVKAYDEAQRLCDAGGHSPDLLYTAGRSVEPDAVGTHPAGVGVKYGRDPAHQGFLLCR